MISAGKKSQMIFIITMLVLALFILLPTSGVQACDINENSSNPIEGYCDRMGYWVPGYITNDTWMTPAPRYSYGKMTFYGPNSMDATAEYRGIDYKEMGCIGGVALLSPIDIGKKVWIRIENEWHGPFCSVDSSKKGDMYGIGIKRETVVELNFDYAASLGMAKQYPGDWTWEVYEWFKWVEVYVQESNYDNTPPYKIDLGEPIEYRQYILDNLEFAKRWEPTIYPYKEDYSVWKVKGVDKYYFNDAIGSYGILRQMMINFESINFVT